MSETHIGSNLFRHGNRNSKGLLDVPKIVFHDHRAPCFITIYEAISFYTSDEGMFFVKKMVSCAQKTLVTHRYGNVKDFGGQSTQSAV